MNTMEIRELAATELDLVSGGEKSTGRATVKIGNLVKIEAGDGAVTIGINGVGDLTLDLATGQACGSLRGVGAGCTPRPQ